MSELRILALSGSLRKRSYNTAAIQALQALAPESVRIVIGDIQALPLFNPDREDEAIPALDKLKSHLGQAVGIVIASPEYAHGISGPMKNALDWLVGALEFPYKPIMLINTSPTASHALTALEEVLRTMSGRLVKEAFVSLPLLGSGLDKDGILADPALCRELSLGLANFCREIEGMETVGIQLSE